MREITWKEWWVEGRGWIQFCVLVGVWAIFFGIIAWGSLKIDSLWVIFFLGMTVLLLAGQKNGLRKCESCGRIIAGPIYCPNCGWECPKCGKRIIVD